MSNISECRKAVKSEYPELKFKIRTVDFTDLARDSKPFLESDFWGMTKGNNETYQNVKAICDKYNVIAMW